MKERIIYRPNCFTLEQWEALSREVQITWWNEEASKPGAPKITKILAGLQRMSFGNSEAARFIIYNTNADDITAGFTIIPEDIVKFIRGEIRNTPSDSDDKAWAQIVFFCSTQAHGSTTSAQLAEIRQQDKQMFRGAVFAFRRMDSHPQSGGIKT